MKRMLINVGSYVTTKVGLFICQDFRRLKIDREPKIIILDLPTHGNLGDHAIAVAEYEFIKEKYPQSYIYRFSHNQCRFCLTQLKKYIKDEDKIFLPGGGFLGTLWKNENDVILKILCSFKKNKIVIFPQTAYFDENCVNEIEKFKLIVDEHSNLTICVRERKSYAILRRLVNCDILLVPDIVFTYQNAEVVQRKNGKILLCFRNDKERIFDPGKLIKYLDNQYLEYEFASTIEDSNVSILDANKVVRNKIRLFSSYSLVICDRLHAMIFSYLGETPCISYDNISQKVSGVYEWISDAEGCKCISHRNEEFNQINDLMNLKVKKVDLSNIFSHLYEII